MLASLLFARGAAAQSGEAGGEVDWEEQPYLVMDGKVDYGTYNGFRRYHSYCHVCHGPDGMGSSFAPALTRSLQRMDYYEFTDVVVNGRRAGNSVMPSFGENLNVMCYIDDLYVYLEARAQGALQRADLPAVAPTCLAIEKVDATGPALRPG